jgi:3-dehydroquinate dehydratase-2
MPQNRGGNTKTIINRNSMASPQHLLLLNGPNLNLLGTREPEIYGATTLADIESRLQDRARQAKVKLVTFQSNAEAALVERVQQAGREGVDFILINPAAFTHTSVALRDALAAVAVPFVEIHLSNVFARESFRHKSYFSDLAVGIISGLGPLGYELALDFALRYTNRG